MGAASERKPALASLVFRALCSTSVCGISGAEIYLVRFISCVALHAIWSGASAIFIYKHNHILTESEHFLGTLLGAAALVSISMVLHGLYDTLLKKEMDTPALVVAELSFVWLAVQVEAAKMRERRQAIPTTVEPADNADRIDTAANPVSVLTPME